jgi:hypothetical protein
MQLKKLAAMQEGATWSVLGIVDDKKLPEMLQHVEARDNLTITRCCKVRIDRLGDSAVFRWSRADPSIDPYVYARTRHGLSCMDLVKMCDVQLVSVRGTMPCSRNGGT